MPDTYAIIQNGVVVNTILWDATAQPNYQPEDVAVKITDLNPRPGIGWTYDGTNFTAPEGA